MEPHVKNRLTAAIAAADTLTIKITAMDSLNSCWRLGQTTSFSSSNVAARKFPDRVDSASDVELAVVVSSDGGLVTEEGDLELTKVPQSTTSNDHLTGCPNELPGSKQNEPLPSGLKHTRTPLTPVKRSSNN